MKSKNTKVHLYFKTRNNNYLFGCKKDMLARRVRLRGFRARSPNTGDVTCPGCKRSDLFKVATYNEHYEKVDDISAKRGNLDRECKTFDQMIKSDLWGKLPAEAQKLLKNERATKKRKQTILSKALAKLNSQRIPNPPRIDSPF